MTELIATPLPGLDIDDGRGRIFDHGAQVCAWRPAGAAQPVLWLSSASAFADDKAIRGGIPLCLPWFGPGLSGESRPAHGFARTSTWRRAEVQERGDVVRVTYELDDSITGEQPEFPHRYVARLEVDFGTDHLEVSLQMVNAGDDDFTFEEALHTYLAVSDVRSITIEGLEEARYLDKLLDDPAFELHQDGPLQLTGPTDRVYVHDGDVIVDDPGFARRLRLSSSGAANVVVWNPWEQGAAGMADMGAGEWAQMVCVEAANALTEAITLRPGEQWTMSQRIEVITD